MTDTYQLLSREDFIAKHGYDPAPAAQPLPDASQDEPYIKNHLRSLAVGVATIPTDLYSLPSTIASGTAALYRSYRDDTKFLDEFQKSIQTEDAQKNIQAHLQNVADTWRARQPGLNEDQIKEGLSKYMKSKQYEDFTMEQLGHFPYVAAKAKDTVRRLLGDERTDDQRGWTESAAEVLGGAIVGGPGGWATGAGSAAAKAGGIANTLVNNPITRGAIKTAEVLTPATVPYTGTNLAINAGAGLAVDQAVRYAQGKSTAFTPTQEDSAGIGTLAATGAGVAGIAAFVAAIKGRSGQVLQQSVRSPTADALKQSPGVDVRVSDPARPGEAIIRGGPEAEYEPPSALGEMGVVRGTFRRIKDLFVGEGEALDAQIRDIHGGQIADDLEAQRMSSSYAVLNDTIPSDVSNAMRSLQNAFDVVSPEESRAIRNAWWLTSDTAQNRVRYEGAVREINDLQNKINHPNTTSPRTTTVRPEHDQARSRATASPCRVSRPGRD